MSLRWVSKGFGLGATQRGFGGGGWGVENTKSRYGSTLPGTIKGSVIKIEVRCGKNTIFGEAMVMRY